MPRTRGRGETYRSMERYDEALADFDHALQLAPDEDWPYYDYALTCQLVHREEEAARYLAQAIQQARQRLQATPNHWRIRFNLALGLLAAGQTAEAQATYEAAVAQGATAVSMRGAIGDLEEYLR